MTITVVHAAEAGHQDAEARVHIVSKNVRGGRVRVTACPGNVEPGVVRRVGGIRLGGKPLAEGELSSRLFSNAQLSQQLKHMVAIQARRISELQEPYRGKHVPVVAEDRTTLAFAPKFDGNAGLDAAGHVVHVLLRHASLVAT